MASSQKPASSTHVPDEEAAKVLDGASIADYESSDMARAVHKAQGEHGMDVDRKSPAESDAAGRKVR